jgi:carbonic anhydrase
MKEYHQLLLANKAWSIELKEEHPKFFSRQVGGQQPQFLWIGCSDSRVNPEQMTMSLPGGMFIHRNIANLVHDNDLNLMAVLQYAVSILRVKHVIICGHYGCGGIKAAMTPGGEGPIQQWLANARVVYHDHAADIERADDEDARFNNFVEINVREQLMRLARTDTIRSAFAAGQELLLHGWVYNIRDGLITPLLEIDAGTKVDDGGAPGSVP